jgi:hypothetical protein
MDRTQVATPTIARPTICLFGGNLAVAWSQAGPIPIEPANLRVSIGPTPDHGPFAPTITALGEPSSDDVGLTTFAMRLTTGFVSVDGQVHIRSSADGVTFGPRVDLGLAAAAGVSLAADDDRLYAAWNEAGSNRIVIASSSNGLVFDEIVKLGYTSEYTPAITLVDHVYYGKRMCLVWIDDTRNLRVSAGPRSDPARLEDAAARLPQTTRAAASVYAYVPVGEQQLRIVIGYLDEATSQLGLITTNADLLTFSPADHGPGVRANSALSMAYDAGVTRLAYASSDWAVIVGDSDKIFDLPGDLRGLLGQPCDPRQCTPDPRLVCIVTENTHLELVPAQIRNAERGHLILSAADGEGAIGTILRGVSPKQYYDHMGIMVEDYFRIRHCTESKDRLQDEYYYQGSVLGEQVPTNGLRADHVRYGWPGTITQSIDDGFYTGFNTRTPDGKRSLNPEWDFYTLNPGEPFVSPDADAKKFFTRLVFFDPERPTGNDKGEGYNIVNLGLAPAYRDDHPGPVYTQVFRPPRGAEWTFPWVPWLLGRIADEAKNIRRGHYRFHSYSRAAEVLDASHFAPPLGDPAWAGLPAGADWAAGSPGIVCSTFIWLAAQNAMRGLVPPLHIGDKVGSPEEAAHQQTGVPTFDGLYQYSELERAQSAEDLYNWAHDKVTAIVKQKVDKAYPTLARIGLSALLNAAIGGPAGLIGLGFSPEVAAALVGLLTDMPNHVANQICMAFAFDAPDQIESDAWKSPGIGVSVSPDDIMNYWDAPEQDQQDVRHGPYSVREDALITRSRVEEVPEGVYALSAGVALVLGLVQFEGRNLVGADVWIGCRHTTTNANGFQLAVPASDKNNGPQLIRAYAYWTDPASGRGYQLHGELQRPLPPGTQNVGAIQLELPLEWRRRIQIHGKLKMTHQVLIGHDTMDEPNFSNTAELQYQGDWVGRPDYDPGQQGIDHTFPFESETAVCGGEKAVIQAKIDLQADLSLNVMWSFVMYDNGDIAVITGGSFVVPKDDSKTLVTDLKDADEPPDRGHCELTIDNERAPA